MLFAYSVPWLGRALARRGDPAAGGMLAAAWDGAQRQRLLLGVAYAGLASVEWAWLAGRPEIAERVAAALAPRLAHPGAAPFRAELARYLARAGLPAEPFEGCPEPWAAGLRGDWRAAADGWATRRRPLRAGARADRVRRRATVAEGLRILDAMDAAGAAARVRATLRAAGMPAGRGPRADHAREPGGPDRAPTRRARAAQRGPHQRADRGAAGALGAHGRPPRGGGAGEARRAVATRRGARRRGAAATAARPRRDYSTLSPITPGARPALSTVSPPRRVDRERVERALGVADVDRRREAREARGGAGCPRR